MVAIPEFQPVGNTRLVKYGIQTEGSDLRAHVAVIARRIYVYRTECGIAAIESGKYQSRPAYTGSLVTAMGYLVPPQDIPGLLEIKVHDDHWNAINIQLWDTTTEKGNKAVEIVKWTLLNGYFPLPMYPYIVNDYDLQIQGTDILVNTRVRAKIQVKCDYKAGPRVLGGTGNLYLQTEECNPYALH